jgi:hypothetical protein
VNRGAQKGRAGQFARRTDCDRSQQQRLRRRSLEPRIQVFDTDGKFLRMFTIDVPPVPGTKAVNGNTPTGERLAAVIGAPNSICITPGANQVMFVGESTFPGRVFKVSLDGKVLGVIGRSGRSSNSSPARTRSRARRRTRSTSPRPRTGACRRCDYCAAHVRSQTARSSWYVSARP